MNTKTVNQENHRSETCARSGAQAVSDETCLKCGFKCIEGSV